MRFDLVTLFPEFFDSPLQSGLLSKALARGIAEVHCLNPRDFTTDKHHRVDDEPYGGGVGMLIKPEPIFAAVESLPVLPQRAVLLMTPQGKTMNQDLFRTFTNLEQLVIICGHYEGVDERVLHLVTQEVSLGDFVLTCGEIPALALLNGVIRLLPGTVGKAESLKAESFEAGLLDYPQYTRPAVFRDWQVPAVLLSGNHGEIDRWRRDQQLQRTRDRRPDLLPDLLEDRSASASEPMNIRIGNGYDIHRLVPGRPLILGGVKIPHELGLEGHSDADVLTHAIMDALLGALSLGDIGHYFPPTDPQWAGADSLKLLAQVNQLVQDQGWQISNIDSVVIAERPKLKPHLQAMGNQLCGVLQLRPDQVGIKATTNEKLGPEGREEGIAAHAVVLLVKEEQV